MSKKCKNNMNLNVQPCHAELVCSLRSSARSRSGLPDGIAYGPASIEHLNPHVISRLTGNPGNKDFNVRPTALSSPLGTRGSQRGLEMQTPHYPQSGRSMVEMLGTLAIMGVLSVGAIGGYSYAMNKHRTNELIYEATKQAQWAGTQMEMNRSVIPTLTGGTFGGGTIETTVAPGLPATQVGIQLTNLNESVCESLSRIVEDNPNGVVRAVQADCNAKTATLVFNRDLSTTDSQDSGESGNESGNEEPEEPQGPTLDCGDHGEQVGSSCSCDFGWKGDACSESFDYRDCSDHGSWIDSSGGLAGYCDCEDGYYGVDCSEQTVKSCDVNSDCDNGYFCRYDYTNSDNINCVTGPVAQGTCEKISHYRGGSYNGYTWGNVYMDWFTTENFCHALGKRMVSLSDFNCPYTWDQYQATSGSCCATAGDNIYSGCNGNYSSTITTLLSGGIPGRGYWMQDLGNDPCNAGGISIWAGFVATGYRRNDGHWDDSSFYALCK